jgi:hypothetical protein
VDRAPLPGGARPGSDPGHYRTISRSVDRAITGNVGKSLLTFRSPLSAGENESLRTTLCLPRPACTDHETQTAVAQRVVRHLANTEQYDAMARRPANRTIRPDALGLSLGEEHGFGVNRVAVKPSRRRLGADDRNAVTVIKKPAQPGDVAIPPTEWWIHEHQAGPRLSKTAIAVGEDPTGRHPVLWSR